MLHNAGDNALNTIYSTRRFEETYRPHLQNSIQSRRSTFEDYNDTFLRNVFIHLVKAQCHIAEDLNPQIHPCRELKTCLMCSIFIHKCDLNA